MNPNRNADVPIGINPPPQQIAIISPSIGNYGHLWPAPGRKELQIKKGP